MKAKNIEIIKVQMFPDERMDNDNAAIYTGYTKSSLNTMRTNKTGPEFIKIRGRVYYYKNAIDNWMKACTGV